MPILHLRSIIFTWCVRNWMYWNTLSNKERVNVVCEWHLKRGAVGKRTEHSKIRHHENIYVTIVLFMYMGRSTGRDKSDKILKLTSKHFVLWYISLTDMCHFTHHRLNCCLRRGGGLSVPNICKNWSQQLFPIFCTSSVNCSNYIYFRLDRIVETVFDPHTF